MNCRVIVATGWLNDFNVYVKEYLIFLFKGFLMNFAYCIIFVYNDEKK